MTSTDQTVQPDQISPADELFPSDALGEAARLSLPGTDSAPRDVEAQALRTDARKGEPLGLGAHTHGYDPDAPRHGSAAPASSRGERRASFDVADFVEPTGREEEWRFTPLDRIRPLLAGLPSDGRLDRTSELPAGVVLDEIPAGDPRLQELPAPADRLAALAAANSRGAVRVTVPAGVELTEPVLLNLRGTGADEVVWGQTVVEVGAGATATVVLDHAGDARYDGNVAMLIGDGAQVTVVTVQDWAPTAVHVGQHDAVLGRDSTLRHVAVSFGGDLVRLSTNVRYAGPGARAELLGVYFADAGQHLEHRLFVDHSVAHCTSDVAYRGALQGAGAHAVWVGDVLIRAAAEGTSTYEVNRNLVLSEGARVDSIPNLEIETGQIEGAGHASTTGRFDDEQLFYLQARGIPEAEARRLVVFGFFTELINRIGLPGLQDRLIAAVERELSSAVPATPTPIVSTERASV
jgi:Fe-S cluster assembly protein SufD